MEQVGKGTIDVYLEFCNDPFVGKKPSQVGRKSYDLISSDGKCENT